jgi:hypothetical protein
MINDRVFLNLIGTDTQLVLPVFQKLIIDYNNDTYTLEEKYIDSMTVRDNFQNVTKITIADVIEKAFLLLDSYVDDTRPELKGEDLKEKYNKLDKNTDFQIIFSQIYLLLRTFRNAKVHELGSINVDGEEISVIRKDKKGKDIKLVADRKIIYYILSYAIHIRSIAGIGINEYYKQNFSLWYYSMIKEFLIEFFDEGNSISLIDTQEKTIFCDIGMRYICENIKYRINDNLISFCIKPSFLYSPSKRNNPLDFVFSFNDRNYMIPYEVVENGSIANSNLAKFEFYSNNNEYLNNFYTGLKHKNNMF